MDVSCREPNTEAQHDQHPLLLDRMDRNAARDHIVDISGNDNASSSSSHDDHRPPRINLPPHVDRVLGSSVAPIYEAASSSENRSNTGNSSFMSRGEGYSRRRRSPLNSGLWISVELIVTVSQIIASVVILSLSRNENPQAPLFAWIVGYASGCVAMIPVLFWRYRNRNQESQPDSIQPPQQSNPPELTSYTVISGNQGSDEENNQTSETTPRNNAQSLRFLSTRVNGLVDHFKMTLDCFFAVWFVVGNVWIFGGHSSPSDAPKLYRLCIVFLTFSCIGYAMPFILCATICCCLPCIISVLGIREDRSQSRGATNELIDSLPTYKFKLKKDRNTNNQELDSGSSEGGILAAGTDKEREISGEDAACCICLARYADNDELRELPCSHVFHVECVDKWLKINATCPLCKAELGDNSDNSSTVQESGQ